MTTPMEAFAPKLSLFSVVLFGLAYMSPGIVMSTFGIIASTSGGAAPTAYIVGTIAMLLTALSYGKMARLLPASGSAYTYARRMIDSRVGFLAGWAILLDYFFLPMVAWLIQSVYLNAQFPGIPVWVFLVGNIALTTIVNVLGIVLTDRVNRVLLMLTTLGIVAFIAVCLEHLATHGTSTVSGSIWSSSTTVASVTAAAAISAYSFLGFDAISTLAEETKDAARNIPRGIVTAVLVGGAIFIAVAFIMQLVHPGGRFRDPATAAYDMSILIGGKSFANVVNIVGIVGGFASGLAIQASTSRLMFVMGRDGVFPRRFFGRLHPKFQTPVPNLLLIAVASLLALKLSLDTAASFINFGAFLTFTVVNLCVIAYFLRQRHARPSVFGFVVLPVLGAVVDLYLLTQLSSIAIKLGLGWLVLGVIYLLVLTRGFRVEPPEMHTDAAHLQATPKVEPLPGAPSPA